MADNIHEPGGFLPPSLPSPSPSNATLSSTVSNLPRPRSHPLRPGSAKEEAARRYVEGRLAHISRRCVKKFQPAGSEGGVQGYKNMKEVSKDLGEVVDVIWLSAAPSLQIPQLLNIAGLVSTYLSGFPPAPNATFRLLRKLDHAFASLLKGEDTLTGDILPGFERGMKAGMSTTDMVRCKGLVENTRVVVVEIMNKEGEVDDEDVEENPDDEEETGESSDMDMDVDMEMEMDDKHDMDVAMVYEQTIVILGELLGGSNIIDTAESGD